MDYIKTAGATATEFTQLQPAPASVATAQPTSGQAEAAGPNQSIATKPPARGGKPPPRMAIFEYDERQRPRRTALLPAPRSYEDARKACAKAFSIGDYTAERFVLHVDMSTIDAHWSSSEYIELRAESWALIESTPRPRGPLRLLAVLSD